MLSLTIPVLLNVAALGLGLVPLHLLRLRFPSAGERLAWAWPLGFGILGWVGFFLGLAHLFAMPAVIGLTGLGGLCLVVLRPSCPAVCPPCRAVRLSRDPLVLALAAAVVVVLAGDVIEGLAPPADADSLAYHFVFAKHMAESGGLVFEPRAVDGAIPQLTHVTYAMALLLGGERAMTLWCGFTGWLAVPLLFCAARRHVSTRWALVLVLVFVTLPAMLYAGGTGQAEPRTAAFALAAILAVAAARRQGARWAVLAGLLAGFYAASKFPGLLVAAAAAGVLLTQRRGLPKAIGFSLAVVVAGFQWYAWNVANSGDPVFPMLYRLGLVHADLWNAAQDAYYRSMFSGTETAIAKTPWWLVAYPVLATFAPDGAFDAGRIGFGAFPVVALPFALAGAWGMRRRLAASPLRDVLAVGLLSYVLWFFLGPSQRVRHLLPLMPAALLLLGVAAGRAAGLWPCLSRPLAAVAVACLAIQGGGTVLADLKVVRHLLSGESRDQFLDHNVAAASAARWISDNLDGDAYLFTIERQLNYLLAPRHFYGNDMFQALVEIRPDNVDRRVYWHQLRGRGFTHVLVRVVDDPANMPAGGSIPLTVGLAGDGCLELVRAFRLTEMQSRALPGMGSKDRWLHLYRLRPQACPYESAPPAG